jgi:hypothetical protein
MFVSFYVHFHTQFRHCNNFYHIHHLNDVILLTSKILLVISAINLCISLKISGYKHYVIEIISMYMDFDGLLLKVYIMLIFED